MKKRDLHYSVVIRWSDEDQMYIASMPEWGPFVRSHGKTYNQALKNGLEVLQRWVETTQREGRPLPQPDTYPAKEDDGAPNTNNGDDSVGLGEP